MSSSSSAKTGSASALSAGLPETVISFPRTWMSLANDFSINLRISSPAPSRFTICCGSGTVIFVCTRAAALGPLSAEAALGGGLVVMGRPRGPAAAFRPDAVSASHGIRHPPAGPAPAWDHPPERNVRFPPRRALRYSTGHGLGSGVLRPGRRRRLAALLGWG